MDRLASIDRAFTDETRTCDSANRLLTIDNTSVGQATYTWDANSNKLGETWTGNMAAWSFTTEKSDGTFTDGYDAEDRFRRFIQSSQSNDIYLARSDIGNITDVEINSTSHLRSYSNAHELTTVDGTTQTFDDDGNLTLSHHGITVNWDDANRLTQTVVPATATAGIEGTNDYGYDADGKRVWKKITRSGAVAEYTVYIYAGPNCIAEYNSGALAASPVQEYVYADGIDSLVLLSRNSDADRYVATRNQQWSITALADISNGTVQERYTYDPFGKRTILAPDGSTLRTASSYNMPYGYTSRRHDDESGLMYFRARFYDPTTGEFTSRDPLEYVDGMSLMRGYLGISGLDPSGLSIQVSVVDDCDPAFSLDVEPEEAPEKTPWSNRDLTIPGVVRAAAYTAKCVSIDCSCDPCGCELEQINCEIKMSFHIFLDLHQIGVEGKTVDGMYGHEQRHVKNYIEELKKAIEGLIERTRGVGGLEPQECRRLEEQYETVLNRVYEFIKGKNNRHEYDEPTAGLSEYDPIGDRPTDPGVPKDCHVTDFETTRDANSR